MTEKNVNITKNILYKPGQPRFHYSNNPKISVVPTAKIYFSLALPVYYGLTQLFPHSLYFETHVNGAMFIQNIADLMAKL